MMENMKYYLDRADNGCWLIKKGSERYTAGYDKQKVVNLIARLNNAQQPIVLQRDNNEIFVCWEPNDRNQNSDWVFEIRDNKQKISNIELIKLLEDCRYPIIHIHEGNHDESELLSRIDEAIKFLKKNY